MEKTYYSSFYRRGPSSALTPHVFKNEIKILGGIPLIFVDPKALEDMYLLVDLANDEIGWIGTAHRLESGDILIKEIFLIDQDAHGATTEITSQGLADFTMKTLSEKPGKEGVEIVNSLRLWGHSHVWMQTNPSVQDDTCMKVISNGCTDFFIRAILNKNGRMEITLYLFDSGIIVNDAAWSVYQPGIDAERRAKWQAEIEEKVKKKTYKTPLHKPKRISKGSFSNEDRTSGLDEIQVQGFREKDTEESGYTNGIDW